MNGKQLSRNQFFGAIKKMLQKNFIGLKPKKPKSFYLFFIFKTQSFANTNYAFTTELKSYQYVCTYNVQYTSVLQHKMMYKSENMHFFFFLQLVVEIKP